MHGLTVTGPLFQTEMDRLFRKVTSPLTGTGSEIGIKVCMFSVSLHEGLEVGKCHYYKINAP